MKKRQPEEDGGSERFIIPYADLITLLLGFFIVLYALSGDIDEVKKNQLGDTFESIFEPRAEKVNLTDINNESDRSYRQPLTQEEEDFMKSVAEQNNLREIQKEVERKIKEEGLEEEVKTYLEDNGLRIVLTNEVLFDSGSDVLSNNKSINLIDFVGEIIIDFPNRVSVEGHTDNVPIGTANFDSNWELSSARSLSVLKEMLTSNEELDPKRFSATGYGEGQPISSNETASGREDNRRVEIIIIRQFADDLLKIQERGDQN